MPVRIQRKRIKGWRMPSDTVYVGRGSRWGNPYKIGEGITPAAAVKLYAAHLLPFSHHGARSSMEDFFLSTAILEELILTLRGKNLACWCPLDQPCHADFLLQTANDDSLTCLAHQS